MKYVAVILVLIYLPVIAWGQETYNFYFQKDPGPTTVIQGKESLSSGRDPVESAAPVRAVAPPTSDEDPIAKVSQPVKEFEEAPDFFRSWYLNLGWSKFLDMEVEFSGLSVQAGYRFHRYFGFEAGVILGRSDRVDTYQGKDHFEQLDLYSLGLTITPVTFNIWGFANFELTGLIGGSYRFDLEEGHPYVGAQASLGINPNFAFNIYTRNYFTEEAAALSGADYFTYGPEELSGITLSMRF